MNKPLSLVHTAEQTEPPQLDGPTEPCIVTGPNDPHAVRVQLGDTDDDGDTDDTVYVTFEFSDGRSLEISLDDHRADYIGGLLKKAHTMVEERRDAEMAAFCATLCPVHDGCVTDGSACTCDGGTNGAGGDEGPEVRVFHGADGWTVSYEPGTQTCTINHVPEDEGRQTCAATAVWKVVQQRDFGLTIGFWCHDHLPAEHRHLAVIADA